MDTGTQVSGRKSNSMRLEELHAAIETYPQRLYTALEAVDKAEKAIDRINEQIEEEEASLPLAPETAPESEQSDADREAARLKLDHEQALLDLDYDRLKGEVEMNYRRNPPAGDRVAEATVAAIVKSDTRLVEAKKKCIDKEHERREANIARRVDYRTMRAEKIKDPVTSPKLERLRTRLAEAELSHAVAEMRLEEVKASLETYQMLVQLYTTGLIK